MNIKINGVNVKVEKGKTILEAAKLININIPTLCHMKMIDGTSQNCKGTCRVCVVEVVGSEKLAVACSEMCREGMNIQTNSKKAKEARKTIVELLLSNHTNDCLKCDRNMNCELRRLAGELGVDSYKYEGEKNTVEIDDSNPCFTRNMNKCILCRRCITACSDVQGTNILTPIGRGFNTVVGTAFNSNICESNCTYCGQCVAVCPTGALTEKMDYKEVSNILGEVDKYTLVQVAPAVRVALCEEFNVTMNEITPGKIVKALKLLGFNGVYDTNFSADLTIMEEASEFLERYSKKENLPLITSCCPAWVRYGEKNYKSLKKYISSCKSPQQMFGAVAKNYLPKKLGINRENIVSISIMPCIAKKGESKWEDLKGEVDYVLTTREFAKLIVESGIDIVNLNEEEFDNPLGVASGGGAIFGTSGGVMEAALRTAVEWASGEEIKTLEFNMVRGLEGIKETSININGDIIKVLVISSLKNAKPILDDLVIGKCEYDFIEIMACPGGCIDGGGQPFIKGNRERLSGRMNSIYKIDKESTYRKCHENPFIKSIYEEYLEKPNSKVAHKLLHRE
ncbi:MAG: NADH-dependent [FeFe] hydrogenase, group A6 [Clostridium sp.]